jgi:hypothetical protein
LLIFAAGGPSLPPDIPFQLEWGAGLAFEWAMLGDVSLVDAAGIPPTRRPVQPCYGLLERLWDYRGVPPEIAMDVPAVVEGTKIGGLCPWLDDPYVERLDRETGTPGAPGIYLGTLATVAPDVYADGSASAPALPSTAPASPAAQDPASMRAWRQARVRAQLHEHYLRTSRSLMIADAGLLNFFLDDSERIRWTAHCHP